MAARIAAPGPPTAGVASPVPATAAADRRLSLTIAVLAGANVVAATVATHLLAPVGRGWHGVHSGTVLLFIAVFAALSCVHLRIELGRHTYSVTLVESAALPAWFLLPPAVVVAAFGVGAVIGAVRFRQTALKAAFNVSASLLGAAAGSAVFALAGRNPAPGSHGAWMLAVCGVMAYNLASAAEVVSVVAVKEDEAWAKVLRLSAPSVLASAAAAASLGLITWQLYLSWAPGPLVLVPVLGVVVVANRAMTRQRADQLRFERLYEASARVAGLGELSEVLGSVAAEARRLVTATTALCVAVPDGGAPEGMLVDDRGERSPMPAEQVAAVLDLAGTTGPARVASRDLAPELRAALPPADLYVIAPSPVDAPARVVIVAGRPPAPAGAADKLADVLGAFTVNASMSVLNATLFHAVRASLAHQIDLNRQKTEFVANVSHELRTPLTFLIGTVSAFRRSGDRLSPDQRQQLLAMAGEEGERLRRLIEDLLVVAATEHGSLRVVPGELDVGVLLAEAVEQMGHRGPGRIRLAPFAGVATAFSDRTRLRQIVDILLDNAMKYGGDGPIELSAGEDGPWIRVTVVDHGPGIPAEDRARVFERFVQLDGSATRRHGGTGIGLHLARELSTSLGGRVELSPTPGGGCTFDVWVLRRLDADAGDGPDRSASPTGTPAPEPAPSPAPR